MTRKKTNNFQVGKNFSEAQLDQSDFGRMFFNLPHETFRPKSIKELAGILKLHNQKRIPVTIRNAGHSVNGQTLTSGVQISLGGLNKVRFSEKKLQITAEGGASWNEVLKGIGFP